MQQLVMVISFVLISFQEQIVVAHTNVLMFSAVSRGFNCYYLGHYWGCTTKELYFGRGEFTRYLLTLQIRGGVYFFFIKHEVLLLPLLHQLKKNNLIGPFLILSLHHSSNLQRGEVE